MFFFFFFYDSLYRIKDIRDAFEIIVCNKLLADGYVDLSAFLGAKLKKEVILEKLVKANSKYAVLYTNSYPDKNRILETWNQYFETTDISSIYKVSNKPTYDEAEAIVYWIYRCLENKAERENFTKDYVKNIELLKNHQIEFRMGVAFDDDRVVLKIMSSVTSITKQIEKCLEKDKTLFFRGHSNCNYTLLPYVMRKNELYKNENKLYKDLLIECPDSFEKCKTHLEKLEIMQHYGLPTRLLDITKNILVALYFACESNKDLYGELVLISAKNGRIKYPDDDKVIKLSCIPALSYKERDELAELVNNPEADERVLKEKTVCLVNEMRIEKPIQQITIEKEDIKSSCVVYASKNNRRIIKQDGAFIICGLLSNDSSLNNFRYTIGGKKLIILVNRKNDILKQLQSYSINHSTLFPEIEHVSRFLLEKYS